LKTVEELQICELFEQHESSDYHMM